MKNVLKKIFVFFMLLPIITLVNVKADSGWDSNYDSGYSGGYSSDYGSNYDFDYSSNDNDSNSYFDFVWLFFILIIALVQMMMKKSEKKSTGFKDYIKDNYEDMKEELFNSVIGNKDINEIKKLFKNKYVAIQKARSDFNYESLEELCTKKMYNTLVEELKNWESKNEKCIICDFDFKDLYVIDAYELSKQKYIEFYVRVSYINYFLDKDGNLLRGSNEYKITDCYIMKFAYDKEMVLDKVTKENKSNIVK